MEQIYTQIRQYIDENRQPMLNLWRDLVNTESGTLQIDGVNAVCSMVCRNVMHYEKIRKHVYIDYEKSYDYAELICAFCGGVSYNRNDYISESYYSFLIRMGES